MKNILEWLLDSDISIQYQVNRDLLSKPANELLILQKEIEKNGWVKELLSQRKSNGHWGNSVYNPKWTCTHYVLYELVQLEIDKNQRECKESCLLLLNNPFGKDGGINFAKTIEYSDVCINGMILTTVCYFQVQDERIKKIIDYLLNVRMFDGGWNCEYFRGGSCSSFHTTISVIEGLETYINNGYEHRKSEVENSIKQAIEYLLKHKLYKSVRTGEIVKDEFFKYCFPIRWKYDILRCLDLFRKYKIEYDERMTEALDIIEKSKNKNGKWKAFSQPGKVYFEMEKNGRESKWNTLRAMRVLNFFGRMKKVE